VQPNSFPITYLSSLTSIPKILVAPATLAAWTTESPTAPKPNTATEV